MTDKCLKNRHIETPSLNPYMIACVVSFFRELCFHLVYQLIYTVCDVILRNNE